MIEKTSLPASPGRSHNIFDVKKGLEKSIPIKTPAQTKLASLQQTTEVSNKQTSRSIFSLASSLGLPSDKLSASIVSFARFFSLPLKPNVLAAIRQQAFSLTQQTANPVYAGNTALTGTSSNQAAANTSAYETSALMKMRETLSLAAAAAESKGVELNQKSLEQYAQAVDPDLHNQQDKERRHEKRRDKNQNGQEEKTAITFAALEKIANENTPPLLEILNRMPGKENQRWIVLPFNFSKDGKEFYVSMRVLLENENRAVRMAIEITEDSGQLKEKNEQRTLLFVFENNYLQQNEGLSSNKFSKLTLFFKDELLFNEQEMYKKELSKLLEIPFEQIYLKQSLENFPFEGACEDQFTSIDETV